MRLLGRILLAAIIGTAVGFAVVNRQPIDLDLGAWRITVPLYLLLIATLTLGLLIGWTVGWFGAARYRHRARLEARRARAAEERLAVLERQHAASPTGREALVSPRLPPHLDDE